MSIDSKLSYWLDLVGTNVKGVPGNPPTGTDVDTDSTLWVFNVPEYTMMSPDVPDGCVVQVTLEILLGKTKSSYGWFE